MDSRSVMKSTRHEVINRLVMNLLRADESCVPFC